MTIGFGYSTRNTTKLIKVIKNMDLIKNGVHNASSLYTGAYKTLPVDDGLLTEFYLRTFWPCCPSRSVMKYIPIMQILKSWFLQIWQA